MNTFKQYGRILTALALLAIVVLICVAVAHYGERRFAAGVEAGRNAVLADDGRAQQQVHQAQEALQSLSAAAGAHLHQSLATTLPAIQGQAHDTVETIRTIYRDRPVPVDGCGRPAGVQEQLDAAVQRANAAISAGSDVRSDAAGDAPGPRPSAGVVR